MPDEAKALDLSPANIAKQVEGLLAHAEERQMKGWTTSAHNLRVAAAYIETQAREIERLNKLLALKQEVQRV